GVGNAEGGRQLSAALRLSAGWPAGVLLGGKCAPELEVDGERGYPRRSGDGPVQQLPGQVARFAIPAHGSRLLLPVVRRRRCSARNGANLGQVLRQSEQWRELRDVGQFQGRLFG